VKTLWACLLASALVAATGANGSWYLDERFDTCPPIGWSTVSHNGFSWYGGTGGPNGNYAHGYGVPPLMESGYAALDSPGLNIPQGKTAYYRYQYQFGYGGLPTGGGRFYLIYADTESILASYGVNVTSWMWVSGSAIVTRSAAVRVRFWLGGSSAMMPAIITYDVDTCQISDDPFTAVAPASLGRVKALLR
jgi:hypothetical protein